MYELVSFAEVHWFQAIVYVFASLTAVVWVTYNLFLLWSRSLRCIMVSLRGWPPSHLDADGDWNPAGVAVPPSPGAIPPHPVHGPMKRDGDNIVPIRPPKPKEPPDPFG